MEIEDAIRYFEMYLRDPYISLTYDFRCACEAALGALREAQDADAQWNKLMEIKP